MSVLCAAVWANPDVSGVHEADDLWPVVTQSSGRLLHWQAGRQCGRVGPA